MSNRIPPAFRRAALATAMLTGVGLGAATAPASAMLTGPGVETGQNITVFHNIDFVAVFGYGPVGTVITVDVFRGDVRIGTATGPTVETPEGPGLEVNHGPEGAPQPGDCWTGTTPNILPGDRIVVTEGADTDEVTVDNIHFTGTPVQDAAGAVLLSGIAQRADGTPIPASALDSGEFRGDAGRLRLAPNRIEATPGVPNGFTMVYEAPYNLERNRNGLTNDQIKAALLTEEGHAVGFGHVVPLPLESMLVDGLGDVPGPALGCEGSPAADPGTPVPDPGTPVPDPGTPVPDPGTPVADTTAPTVTGQSPAAGAINVARTANVTATFSEQVDAVSTATVQLLNTSKAAPIDATVTYDAATQTATLNPGPRLAANTEYTVVLTSGITDLARNALTETTWTFRTGR